MNQDELIISYVDVVGVIGTGFLSSMIWAVAESAQAASAAVNIVRFIVYGGV